jgi:predicted metal-dependent peptidase
MRASRRGGDRTDIVLAGRKREGWTLNIVLDTSGSMYDELARVLGAIASFCESVNVDSVRLLQCDVEVTEDAMVTPEQLNNYRITGLGGSDMSPAMLRLADDPEVEAVIVLTDGLIYYPPQAMPYNVLWVLTNCSGHFNPGYGQVIELLPQ